MFKKNLKKLLYFIKPITPDTIVKKDESLIKKILNINNYKVQKDKLKYYVIALSPGAGFFSNFGYVLNHLYIAEKMNLLPIIDMKNFPTHYSEHSKIYSTKNAWEYYFKQISKKKIDNIYKNKQKVFFAFNSYPKMFCQNFGDKKIFKEIKKKYIKLNSIIKKDIKKNLLQIFNKKKKVLGIYFRAGDMRIAPRHPLPPTKKQIFNQTKKILKKNNFDCIFISSEDKKFTIEFKKKFHYIDIKFLNNYRFDKKHPYFTYPRKNHRFKLGKEILIDMYMLSNCDSIIYSESNVIEAVKIFSKKKQKKHIIRNGYNVNNPFIARWLWYLKMLLPSNFGGFENNI